MKKIFLILVCIFASSVVLAEDVIYLTDGRKLKGEVVSVTTREIRFKYKKGAISSELVFKRGEVDRIMRIDSEGKEVDAGYIKKKPKPKTEDKAQKAAEPEPKPEPKAAEPEKPVIPSGPDKREKVKADRGKGQEDGEYQKQLEKADKEAAASYVQLAQWCERNGRDELARENYKRALILDPRCAAAGEGLGLVFFRGKWIKRSKKLEMEKEEAENEKRAERMRSEGYELLAGVWVTAEFNKLVSAAPDNRKYSYVIILQSYREVKNLSGEQLMKFDRETLAIWEHLAPDEQRRICPTLVGKKFPKPKPPKMPVPGE